MDKMMVLKRKIFTENTTIGELYMPDGSFQCYTLEDPTRKEKIPGNTAIPSGTFEVAVTWSNKFQKPMPLVMNVPFYDGIRIHPGNGPQNTEGCLLVGRKKDVDYIEDSILAFEDLFPKIRKMCGEGKLFIEIQGGFPKEQWTGVSL